MSTPSAPSFLDDPLAIFAASAPAAAAPPAPAAPPVAAAPPPVAAPAAPPPAQQAFTSVDQIVPAPPAGAPAIINRANATVMSLDTEEQIGGAQFDFFKGRAGWTERIGILAPTKIYGGRTHYIESGEKKGRYYCSSVFEKKGGQEICTQVAPCCERLDVPRWRFSAMVIHYITQMNGQLAEPFSFKLKIWSFTDRMFGDLQATNREWKLSEHDLLIKTEDEKFQRLKYDVTKECIYRRPDFLEKYGQAVATWAGQMLPKLDKTVGRRVQPQEWIPLLTGQTPGVGHVVDAPVQDISDVLSRGL